MIDQASYRIAQGRSISCERIEGINDNMSKSHFHDYFEIYYLESGERYHVIDDNIYCIHPGEMALFAPYVMHHSYSSKDVQFKRLLVYFRRESILHPEMIKALEESGGIYKLELKEKQIIYQALKELLHEEVNPGSYQEVRMVSLLNNMLVTLLRNTHPCVKPEKQQRVTSIINYIHTHYQEDLSLDRLSQQFFISSYYLCREFKRFTNTTIIQYINTIRILNAQRMFMETDKNITEISKELGFSNITHFERVFKSITGMSPSQNRKLYHEGKSHEIQI